MTSKSLLAVRLNLEKTIRPWIHAKEFTGDRTLVKVPEHYKKFYWLWKYAPKTRVHDIPIPVKFRRISNEEVVPVDDVPIPVLYPKEFDQMLTGGEGVLKGYTRTDKRWAERRPKYWMPKIRSAVVYSEILDKRINILCTSHALHLIDKSYGLDNYLLQTPIPDLSTELAMKLRRSLLYALTDETLHPDDPVRRNELIDEHKEHLIPREELEWFGLNLNEARLKQNLIEEKEFKKSQAPLKSEFRKQLLEFLKSEEYKKSKIDAQPQPKEKGILEYVNPLNVFGKKD